MLNSARRQQALTRALAARAIRDARRGDIGAVVARYQAAAALAATAAVTAMLDEQKMPEAPEATLVPLAFAASPATINATAAEIDTRWRLDRLVGSLVTDAARAAESVTIATRRNVGYVRYLTPPSCSRCAILASKFYRWSAGFQRHPGCDCIHLPTKDPRSEYLQNPYDLVDQVTVTGLSEADQQALKDGADLSQLVNARDGSLYAAGNGLTATRAGTTSRGLAGKRLGDLEKSSRSRYRVTTHDRLTPDSIYKVADGNRDEALRLLGAHGYII